MKRNEIKKRFNKLLKPHLNKLFFPHGIYGQIVYCLEKDGYFGLYTIPAYMVPVCLSSRALLKLRENSIDQETAIEDVHSDSFGNLVKGINLVQGNRRRLPAAVFIDMVRSGCQPDVYYLDKDFNNGNYVTFFDFLDDAIRKNRTRVSWGDLESTDMKFWCYMLAKLNSLRGPGSLRNSQEDHLPDEKRSIFLRGYFGLPQGYWDNKNTGFDRKDIDGVLARSAGLLLIIRSVVRMVKD